MKGMGLTKMQRDCLDYITARWEENRVPPSYDEMKAHLGLASKSGIHRLITGLEQRGAIVRIPGHARALRPVDQEAGIFLMLPVELDQRLRLIAATLNITPAEYVTRIIRDRIASRSAA